jgi:hypothetical protein
VRAVDSLMRRILAAPPLVRRIFALVALEIAWFALLHPLVPSTVTGFAIEFTAGLAVFVGLYLGGSAIMWLSKQTRNVTLCRIAAVAIAVGYGLAVFAVAYAFKATLSTDFHYFVFFHH